MLGASILIIKEFSSEFSLNWTFLPCFLPLKHIILFAAACCVYHNSYFLCFCYVVSSDFSFWILELSPLSFSLSHIHRHTSRTNSSIFDISWTGFIHCYMLNHTLLYAKCFCLHKIYHFIPFYTWNEASRCFILELVFSIYNWTFSLLWCCLPRSQWNSSCLNFLHSGVDLYKLNLHVH